MLRSYVGVVTPAGLASLVPESAAAVRALSGRHVPAALWWAVLTPDAAGEVLAYLDEGDGRGALVTLDRTATLLGPLLPTDDAFRAVA
jgi:hypothetical protein